jgi:putative transcriptional regulator
VKKSRVRNSIRDLRLAAGLTQQDLAERVDATRQTIIAIEAEKYAPSLELAFRIAEVFDRRFDEVFRYER